ncbi:MAG TPA: hypothetical protein PLA24_04580 [Tenuifilaceae bacterium]|nr:hypothetical protein [Tenuifilaceae bacterium]
MNKCKCVNPPLEDAGKSKFKLNAYYEFDYIPPTKENSSYYRVFSIEEDVSESFNLKAFNQFFKKY